MQGQEYRWTKGKIDAQLGRQMYGQEDIRIKIDTYGLNDRYKERKIDNTRRMITYEGRQMYGQEDRYSKLRIRGMTPDRENLPLLSEIPNNRCHMQMRGKHEKHRIWPLYTLKIENKCVFPPKTNYSIYFQLATTIKIQKIRRIHGDGSAISKNYSAE